MDQAWRYCPTSLALPEAAAARVRARATGGEAGGPSRRLRVPVRRGAAAESTPLGVLFLRWTGLAGPVTIYYLGWNPAAGGTEEHIRRAAAQLARGGDAVTNPSSVAG